MKPWEYCTCGMEEQERTGHSPQHEDWCEFLDIYGMRENQPFRPERGSE